MILISKSLTDINNIGKTVTYTVLHTYSVPIQYTVCNLMHQSVLSLGTSSRLKSVVTVVFFVLNMFNNTNLLWGSLE